MFAEAFTREHEDVNIASASNAIQNGKVSLRNLDQKELELLIKSDSSRYESGDVIYLDVYLKNNSSTKVTDGVLKFSGKGLIKEDGYFEDYQDGYNSIGPGGSSDFEESEEEDEEEELESDEIGTISEDGKLSNIILKPNEVYHVGFYCTVDEFEDMKSSNISFTFRGKQDKRAVSTSNKFEYTIGGMNLMPIVLDEEIETGEEYTMSLDFDLGSKFEEIIEDKILEDEEDIEIKEEKETEETESGTKEESEINSETESNETDNKMESSEIIEETESKIEEDIKDSLGDKDSEDSIEETNDKEIESDIKEEDDKEDKEDKEDNPELSIEKIERHTVKSSLNNIEETNEAIEEDSDMEDSIKETASDDTVSDEGDKKDTELEIEYETNSDNTNVDETESKDTNSIDETEASKEENSETEAEANETEISETETSEDETEANETETSKDNVKNDLDLASPSNIDLDKKDKDKDKDKDKIQVATPSNSYIKWDTEDINKGEKPIIKDIKCEVSSYGVELENFEIAEGGNELNTRLNVKFKVNEDQEPGIYFGKVEATYKYKNKTYKTSQGFMINVLGEVIDLDEEITLVGSLGDTEVTVSGPRRSFPMADELELSVSEVEADKQDLVDSVLSEKQEELGLGISGVKALDIKVLADGEYKELNGDVTVNFKNVGLQGGLRGVRV